MKIFYLKVNSENVVIDALSFPFEGYVEYQTEELPPGVIGGWFKLENGELVAYPELKPEDPVDELTVLKNKVELQEQALAELTMYISTLGV